jgi:hypothetical protein
MIDSDHDKKSTLSHITDWTCTSCGHEWQEIKEYYHLAGEPIRGRGTGYAGECEKCEEEA